MFAVIVQLGFNHNKVLSILKLFPTLLQSFLDLQYSFLDACHEETKRSSKNVEEVTQKKLKICTEEKSETKEDETCAVIETKPTVVEEKEKLPELSECASNDQQQFQTCADISLTFPETPPSFEIDPGEQELMWNSLTAFVDFLGRGGRRRVQFPDKY